MSSLYILHIDTTTTVCSVALADGMELIAVCEVDEPNVHAAKLTLFIEQVLLEAGVSLSQLQAISVSKGPGSYTGLRIGVSVAKGLCYALDIPLLAVDTLYAMALSFVKNEATGHSDRLLYCPMIDARRMEVFTGFYDAMGVGIAAVHALIVDRQSFSAFTAKGKRVVLFGPGADKLSVLFEEDEAIEIIPGIRCSAQNMIEEGARKYGVSDFEDIAYFEPFYLKDFLATKPKKLF